MNREFRDRRRRGPVGLKQKALIKYLKARGALLIYDGTFTTDATPKMKNLGTLAAAGDGTITAVTVDNNGMSFNGSTSKIVIADNAAIQALATYTIVGLCKANSAGENSAGEILHLGASTAMQFRRTVAATGALSMGFDTDGTDAVSTTNSNFVADGVSLAMFGTFDDTGDRKARIYKGASGAVSEASYVSQTAATGTRVAPVGAIVGNFADVRTWDGSMKLIAIVPRILAADDMIHIAKLAGF